MARSKKPPVPIGTRQFTVETGEAKEHKLRNGGTMPMPECKSFPNIEEARTFARSIGARDITETKNIGGRHWQIVGNWYA